MALEKYVSREEAENGEAGTAGAALRKEPPSIAPHYLEEVRKYSNASTAASASIRAA